MVTFFCCFFFFFFFFFFQSPIKRCSYLNAMKDYVTGNSNRRAPVVSEQQQTADDRWPK